MKKTVLTKRSLRSYFCFFVGTLCVIASAIFNKAAAQTVIYSTDFGTVANVNPSGWTFTGVGMNISTNNPSSGYTGASGNACLGEGNSVTFTNTAGNQQASSPVGTSEAILLVSTTSYSNITLSFGMRKSSASYNTNATYTLAWSTDGINYTDITYTEATAGSWGLASGAGLTLPSATWNQSTLYIKWIFVRTGTGSNFKIDDVSITGGTTPATITFLSNDTTVVENAGSANVILKLTSTSTASSAISVSVSALSNASASDYTLANVTVTFAANAPANSTQTVVINLNNDALVESAEYIVLRLYNPQNAAIGAINQFHFYIGDNDKIIPQPSNSLTLNLLSSFSNAPSGSNSAEIVAHDPLSQRLFIANSIGGKLDIVNFANPSSPSLFLSVPITSYGNINSVAVKNGIVAAAIENGTNPQDSGRVVFFDNNGVFLKQVKVGMMPDMITFNHAGTKVLTANEGEPNQAYTSDPDGSIAVIDISGGISALTQTNVSHITFTVYNGQEATLRSQGIRIFGLNASASKDFEPEYITVAPDDSKAWVTLQENNALMEINLSNNSISYLKALGTKDHSLLNNGMDASNMTRSVNISNVPVKGFYLPDAIASYTVGGNTYVITANEGDSRAYTGFTEEKRVAQLTLDATKFPNGAELKNNYLLGRLTVTDKNGDIDNDGDIDTIYCLGGRSFSIWNTTTGNLVYDSKDDLEQITAANSFSVLFNASNSNATKKDRSDDKGPEPEGVAIATIGSNIYAFIALERIGGLMVYNVTNPNAPVYVTYVNNRSLPSNGPDLGAEGVIYIPQSQSPNGQHIVIAANEVSSTLSIWGIPGCASPLSSSLSTSGNTVSACADNGPVLSVPSATGVTYQWKKNGTVITGATTNTYVATSTGNYSVEITGPGSNCSTGSIIKTVTVNPTPTLALNGPSVVCLGTTIAHTLSGAATYSYNSASTPSVLSFTPSASGTFTILGVSSASCSATLTQSFTVNNNPTLTLIGSSVVCQGSAITQTVSGASTYLYNGSSSGAAISFTPAASGNYTVTGLDANNCSATKVQSYVVNGLPIVYVYASSTLICTGQTVTLTATGAPNYSWSIGGSNSVITQTPQNNMTYTVTGINANNCTATAQIAVNVSQCTSIAEADLSSSDVMVYPNPAVNELTISYSSAKPVSVRIVNALGTVVLDQKDVVSGTTLNISGLSKGIYFISVGSVEKPVLKKVIVE